MTEPLTPELRAELKDSLMEAIQEFFDERIRLDPEPDDARERVGDRRLQLATAVLLLEVARVDFDLRADEFEAVADGVRECLGLSEDEATTIIRFAEEEVRQSKRIHEFTRLIDAGYTLSQKKRVVQYLWQVAFADAQILAGEEYLVRKIADLLNVPLADFLDAKIAARDAFR